MSSKKTVQEPRVGETVKGVRVERTRAIDAPRRASVALTASLVVALAGLGIPSTQPAASAAIKDLPATSQAPEIRQEEEPQRPRPDEDELDPALKRAMEERAERVRQQREQREQALRERLLQQGDNLTPEQRQRILEEIGSPELEGMEPPVTKPTGPLELEQDGAKTGSLVGADGKLQLNFSEPVDLAQFADYIARALELNIFIDPGLEGRTVRFSAPVEIPVDNAMQLLSELLDQQGFVIQKTELGFFMIVPAGNAPVDLKDDQWHNTRIISTPLLRPTQLQQTITAAMGQQAGGAAPRIVAVDDLGILIVTGTQRALDTVENFIERLRAEDEGQVYVRFPLEHVSADFAYRRILELNGKIVGAATGVQQGAAAAAAGAGSLSNIDAGLFIDQGNALIFHGDPSEAARVEQFVDMVDVVTTLRSKLYIVGNVAEQVAIAGEKRGLGSVNYQDQQGGQSGSLFRQNQRQPGQFGLQAAQTSTGSEFLVNLEQGTIIYYGTEQQHEIVSDLVETFKEQSLSERFEIQMYKLENADAEVVANLLNEIIRDPQRQSSVSGTFLPSTREPRAGEPTAAEGEVTRTESVSSEGTGITAREEDIIIVADPDRAQVLVKGKPEHQQEIGRLIRKLDQRRPQVEIKAQIISVATSRNFDWTVELQYILDDFAIATAFGLSEPGNTVLDPTSPTAGLRGVTTALIQNDYVPFVINTLETKGDTKIISSPQVLVNDNEEGSVSSEREEPFTSTSQTANSTITAQGGTATAGTVLTVTPQISSGGYINLDFSIELSSFDLGNRQPGLSPPIQREAYDSRVTLPSDTTIVVGGLVFDTSSKNVSQFPLLGDIPFIGAAFQDLNENEQQRTIFVFITPKIVNDPHFIDANLLSEGPMKMVGLEKDLPDLEPAVIPIQDFTELITRRLPANNPPNRP